MTYKPGDKVLVEATVDSVMPNQVIVYWKSTLSGSTQTICLSQNIVHPMPEYQSGETVEGRQNSKWMIGDYIGVDDRAGFFVIAVRDEDDLGSRLIYCHEIRRPQKKYTVELTEEYVRFAKLEINREGPQEPTMHGLCKTIAEQCRD